MTREDHQRAAARRAAALVDDGMRVGLGTGSTVAFLIEELAARRPAASYVATSPRTEATARSYGLSLTTLEDGPTLDLAIDGADQVAPDGWLVKGKGGALTREKIVASASARFVVIVDETKLVDALRPPVPVELLAFGLAATLSRVAPLRLRDAPRTPDDGVLADYLGEVGSPGALARWLEGCAGVVEHGLFAPTLVHTIYVGARDAIHPPSTGDVV
ncbi:MAG: ribose 5-phosphate isomerase A [Acidobacteriota bacterium]|nr:ribose 5-phosphate isomerase A [Acidobacteriota bacterium]